MGRWEPNARERLERSALELFLQQGYESTTAAGIAERAGLAKSTFFRHFSDKREVLFGGQELLNDVFVGAIAGAPESATPIDAIGAALAAVAVAFPPERRAVVRQRGEVVAGHSDLRERELLKLAALTAAMADALRKRGVPDPAASLAAEIGRLALHNAHARWVDPTVQLEFAEIARRELDGLRSAAADLR